MLSTWEASFEKIHNYNPAAARLLSLLAFLNFEDIFLGLFDGDGAGVLASAPDRVAEPSEAMTSSIETWQSFLFSEQQWTVYKLEYRSHRASTICGSNCFANHGNQSNSRNVHLTNWGYVGGLLGELN